MDSVAYVNNVAINFILSHTEESGKIADAAQKCSLYLLEPSCGWTNEVKNYLANSLNELLVQVNFLVILIVLTYGC